MLVQARELLRVRDMMTIIPHLEQQNAMPRQEEGTTGGQKEDLPPLPQHQTRIKEIMQFSDTFIEWLSQYVQEGARVEERMQLHHRGSIMMFRTEEEELSG